MSKFRFYFIIIFCMVITMAFARCGTIKGIGNDISVIGEILKRV